MHINIERLKADGFNEDDVHRIQTHCDTAEAAGTFSRAGSFVQMNGEPRLVCQTIAEILDQLRPGCWLDAPTEGPSTTPKACAAARRTKRRKGKKRGPPTRTKTGSDNQIKVHFTFPKPTPGWPAGEFLWARQISKDTAKITSIPFGTGRLACGDLVRINKDREITKILEHVAKTRLLIYADEDEQTRLEIAERYAEVREALNRYDIITEGMFLGICSISVPKDLDDEQLEILADQLDAQLIVHEDEE